MGMQLTGWDTQGMPAHLNHVILNQTFTKKGSSRGHCDKGKGTPITPMKANTDKHEPSQE
ncbi:hypothetical protein KP79_PYT20207 [Mizuhopecten yessoensis]|uniref:Uncharacterized protein n=1 Tax=Mizuhopecten yessoensis TaxID=6573 RepID=A0A210R7L7_MIZYE|nr:hypothetical protein KP79_PYT20207 [Mizuhopecten yessoensis]